MTRRRNRPSAAPTLPITNVPSTEIVPPSTDTDADLAYRRQRTVETEHRSTVRIPTIK